MATSPIQGCDLKFNKLTGVQVTIPEGGLTADHLSPASGDELPVAKLHHTNHGRTDFGLKVTEAPTAQERWLYTARGPETITQFAAQLFDTGTSTDVDFILKKNGATLMSSDLTITHADTDREVVDGTANLSSLALVAGDTLTVETVVASSTGALGPQAWVITDSVGQ